MNNKQAIYTRFSCGRFAGAASYLAASWPKRISIRIAVVLLLSTSIAVSGQVSISVAQPAYGFNVIPSSTRRIFATVSNAKTASANWKIISGSATLSASAGSWIDVTAPPTGSSCSIKASGAGYTVSSATQFIIEARAQDDPTKTTTLTFNVCKPGVSLAVIPFYRTLYSGQQADVQSLVWGSVNQSVTWAITSQAVGGNGVLDDVVNRDTVFSAVAPGRYVLTATSRADPKKTANAIMYVTGHPMPYRVTPNHTEPVDCSVDPALKRRVYDVGPSQTYKNLSAVPQSSLRAGSTIRVHNEDRSGQRPTTFHEYVQLQGQGTASQPIRICGVPDESGNLPVLDEADATGRSDTSAYAAGFGGVTVQTDHAFDTYPNYHAAKYIVIEGLKIQNAKATYSYTQPNGEVGHWNKGAACIRIAQVQNAVVVGNDLDNCGNGAFSAFNADSAWGGANLFTLWEGNYLHRNGNPESYTEHQLYLQGWGQVAQFNRIDDYTPGAEGSNWKSRGLGEILRYNYIGAGAAREMDLVDVEDAKPYLSFEVYLGPNPPEHGKQSFKSVYPSDAYNADLLAAAQEVWHSHFVYGNIYRSSSRVPLHFSMDHDGREVNRLGTLYWYNNTFYELVCQTCTGELWTLFDTTGGGGNFIPQVEWQNIAAYNNIVWMDDSRRPVFQWNNYATFTAKAGRNLVPRTWGSNDLSGGAGSGWSVVSGPESLGYQNSEKLALHLTGFTNQEMFLTSSIPFDVNSWIAKAGTPPSEPLPAEIQNMPVRFQFTPSVGYPVARRPVPTVGATDAPYPTGSMSARGTMKQ
jgi:hypothetical protein